MSAVTQGRRRQEIALEFLSLYHAATTTQLADLLWGGDQKLARKHLLRLSQTGLVERYPHPIIRGGPYVYIRSDCKSAHSQKVLHHLSLVDMHIAIVRSALGKQGARIIPELPWAKHLIPDQTVIMRDAVWAVEHHLSGRFTHGSDYRRHFEDEGWRRKHWWRDGMLVHLLIVTSPRLLDGVRDQVARHRLGDVARVAIVENVLADPTRYLK